ncbi:tyrosine-protein phosphatase non-receptor type substrate 1-like isoform X2 [Polyodon spathula]|uniref:tyrosine-protein phosphatase non-receptor type substrate 1-like isoform X2 n=1 Tax=Polyodon spathula TaxID=7913 RepID=UPI001B7EA8C8|nr:tyrosine-protein phosphatase non-receptor type substrate 1-like isoform X2 [Polyodon spathula]
MKSPVLALLFTLVQMSRPGLSGPIITQDPGSVTGTEDGEVTIPCTVIEGPPGLVRWYRDTGSDRQYLYSTGTPPPNERNDPRVSQVHQNHPTDLSIRIVNLTLRDSGMYYCEKYTVFDGTLIASGAGSRLSVQALPPPIITQDSDPVTGTEEGEVTLLCTLSREGPAGLMRWYKGTGSSRQHLYSTAAPLPNERNDPRVSRVSPNQPTDLSIQIVNLTRDDSGMYYCEKYKGGDGTLIASGAGSRLSVQEKFRPPVIEGPQGRVLAGNAVLLTCRSNGPLGTKFTWKKNNGSVPGEQKTVQLQTAKEDIRSTVTCETTHPTTQQTLSSEPYSLGASITVKPNVSIEANPERVKVNESISLTCRARGFYPGRVNVSWVQQGGAEELAAERGENVENEDGTFSRDSVLNVTVTQELSAATVSCRVQIEGLLETVQREHTLVMTDPIPDPEPVPVLGSEIAIPVAVTLVVLIALLLAVGLYCRFRAGKKKAEIVRATVLSNETHEKELTYASLDLKKSSRRSMKIAESEICAYAEIKGAKARGVKASADITYASLDEVNLKKKEPGGGRGGEPPGGETEYASVNFRKN